MDLLGLRYLKGLVPHSPFVAPLVICFALSGLKLAHEASGGYAPEEEYLWEIAINILSRSMSRLTRERMGVPFCLFVLHRKPGNRFRAPNRAL